MLLLPEARPTICFVLIHALTQIAGRCGVTSEHFLLKIT